MDPPLDRPAQLPGEALDRVRFGGHTGQAMQTVDAPFMLFRRAHHSRSLKGSRATATQVYFQPICTA